MLESLQEICCWLQVQYIDLQDRFLGDMFTMRILAVLLGKVYPKLDFADILKVIDVPRTYCVLTLHSCLCVHYTPCYTHTPVACTLHPCYTYTVFLLHVHYTPVTRTLHPCYTYTTPLLHIHYPPVTHTLPPCYTPNLMLCNLAKFFGLNCRNSRVTWLESWTL